MALTIGQLLSGAGTIADAQLKAEEARRVARENQLKIEQQNRLDRLRQNQTRRAGGAFPEAPSQYVGFEQIGGAPPGPIRFEAPPAAAPTPAAAPAPAPAPAAAPMTGPAGDTYYEDIYNRLAGERVLGVIPAVRAETMRMLRDPQAFTTEEIGRLYAIAQSKRDYNTAKYLRDVLLGRGVPDLEIRNIRGQTRAGLRAIEEAQATETRRAEEQRRLAELRGERAPTAAPAPAAAPTSNVRGIRNNNPGNLRPSEDQWQGATGVDKEGGGKGYLTFDTPENGIRAMTKNLMTYSEKGINTPEKIIKRWAPAADNNNTEAYIRSVTSRLGVPRSAVLDLSNPNVMKGLVQAIIQHENGVMPYSENVLNAGISAALGLSATAMPAVATAPAPTAEAATTANTAAERLSTPPGVRMTAAQRPESISTYYAANPQNIGPERQNLDAVYQQQRSYIQNLYNDYVRAGMGPQALQLLPQVMELDQKYRSERLMMDGMEALAQLEYGNDPRAISAVLSFYRGQPVNFELVEDGTYRMTMQDQRGQIQQRGVYTKDRVKEMALEYFDRTYVQRQQAAMSEAAMKRFDNELQQQLEITKQQAQTIREVTVETAKANLGERDRAGEFNIISLGDGKVVGVNKAGTKAFMFDSANQEILPMDGVGVRTMLRAMNIQLNN